MTRMGLLFSLVAGERFELSTSGLWARRATGLLYPARLLMLIIRMAEKEGFEPSLGLHLLSVFKTDPFNRLGISPLVDSTGLEPVTDRLWADSSNHCAKSP